MYRPTLTGSLLHHAGVCREHGLRGGGVEEHAADEGDDEDVGEGAKSSEEAQMEQGDLGDGYFVDGQEDDEHCVTKGLMKWAFVEP